MVMGCRNTETYTISKVRDFGNTVLICEICLKEALKEIKNYGKPKPAQKVEPPPSPFYTDIVNMETKVVIDIEPGGEEIVDGDDDTGGDGE